MRVAARGLFIVALCALASGCATVPYKYGQNLERSNMLALRPGEPQISHGHPNALVDGIGWVLGIPSKIILLDSRMDNHHVATNVDAAVIEYLGKNDLHCVKVRVNEYAPGDQWSRLFRNKSVAWPWRYTFGVISELVYTILPGRLIGGDNYDPYANTINLYSNHRAVALHECGHSKDFAPRKYKGTYSFFYMLPLFALYPEARASNDAMSYMRAEKSADEEKQADKILYPAYATYVGGEFGQFLVPVATPVYLAAVVVGHVTGRIEAGRVDGKRAEAQPAPAAPAAEPQT